MLYVNYWAVVVSVVAVFVFSSVYYSLLGKQLAAFSNADPATSMPIWKIVFELLRGLVFTYALAYLFSLLGAPSIPTALGVALLLWVGFPFVLLTGSMLHENVPWQLAALHSGDWLMKLVVSASILSLWK